MAKTRRGDRTAPRGARGLRSLREARQIPAASVAREMGIGPRTYRRFEAGKGPATPERLQRFCEVLGYDYAALWLAAGGLHPGLVVAAGDTKAVTLALDTLADLAAATGPDLGGLTAAELLGAFDLARVELLAAVARHRARPGEADRLLTVRQLDCLRWAQAGKSSTDIGVILGLSPRTVDDHLEEACQRLGVRTRIQAISRAIELGLLSPRAAGSP